MSSTDDLRDIALAITDDGTVTESQEEGPSHEPVGDEESRIVEAAAAASEDGLDEAIAGGESEDGGQSTA